jgi:hypothetical protein
LRSRVQSLGTVVAGSKVFPTVQGRFKSGANVFSSQSPVDIVQALSVSIDIKPGGFPNTIKLGSGGNMPVAIISTSTFDATQVDPLTVTLTSAAVQPTGKGTAKAPFEDVNKIAAWTQVHVSTLALQLSKTDVLC